MLTGKKVVLRRVEPADYPAIQRWQNDPEVFRWMDYQRPFSLEDIRRTEERATEEGPPLIIEVEGRAVGRIGLNNFRARDHIASLYVFVGERSVWGHGYGYDAMMTLLTHAFDTLNLRLVELWMLADNERALRMYKHVGFTEDARVPARSWHDGAYMDHLILSIDRETFERSRASDG